MSASAIVPLTITYAPNSGAMATATVVGQVLNNGATNWVSTGGGNAIYLAPSSADGAEQTVFGGETYYVTTGPALPAQATISVSGSASGSGVAAATASASGSGGMMSSGAEQTGGMMSSGAAQTGGSSSMGSGGAGGAQQSASSAGGDMAGSASASASASASESAAGNAASRTAGAQGSGRMVLALALMTTLGAALVYV